MRRQFRLRWDILKAVARLDHPDHGVIGQPVSANPTAFADWPKQRAGSDVGGVKPSPHRFHRAVIRFLSIGPRFCSTLLSYPASRQRPCASLIFATIRLDRGLAPPSCRSCSAHKKTRHAEDVAGAKFLQTKRQANTAAAQTKQGACPRPIARPTCPGMPARPRLARRCHRRAETGGRSGRPSSRWRRGRAWPALA
jgi:hypothetical protein